MWEVFNENGMYLPSVAHRQQAQAWVDKHGGYFHYSG